MTFVTRKALSRRTFLRGVGTAVALPLLDAMVPALSARAAAPVLRLGFVYISNGVIQKLWNPTAVGTAFELPPILKPLEPVKDYVNVLSGLSYLQADSMGDGNGDHPRASAVWLSGIHAWDRTRPGVEVRLATTADQLAAREIGKGTRLSSLELNLDVTTQGSCDSGDCFFINTVSWRNATTPNPAEFHPRIVFERLFGDGGTSAQRLAQAKVTGSILDSLVEEVNDIAPTLGAGDSTKLTEYLDSIREIEQRIQNTEAQGSQSLELPERPIDVPASFDEHAKLMFDLQALAFQADITRVFTLMLAREVSVRTYPNIGVPEQHHSVSHHRNDSELIAKKARIDTYHAELFTYFLKKLQATPDGDGSLLDHSLIMYGGGMGDGNLHRHSDLPCVLAGKLGGAFKSGRHLAYPLDTPMTNLLLTILDKVGVHTDKIGDSTGRLPLG
ncbi:MAG TPA: DUF1552 domain-containing protein [Candidatus Binatia bacterium]|jgi:hypothetical protein|nr:DUF1552 domain-containing protein [Candidatus Binatia bacterium]